ncbi:MAG TPA: hypothetical protein VN578_21255 [Candidatus Binatia bacterium]|jgi:hypothetical protein|nr:hypothetical protein [Candidatus Binatia bacterium]
MTTTAKNLIRVLVAGILAAAILLYVRWHREFVLHSPDTPLGTPMTVPPLAPPQQLPPHPTTSAIPPTTNRTFRVRHKASELTADEKSAFLQNFEQRYKPAIDKWFKAFSGHVPFAPDKVTPDQLAERIGTNPSYNEYVFVIDGITLGVQDSKGVAQVHYLNAPHQTQKLATLPDQNQPPALAPPVAKEEIAQMLLAESGTAFAPQEIRITPSGVSGSLNGGALVSVGGDAENGASWNYDLAFAPDGKLAYYLKGNGTPPRK